MVRPAHPSGLRAGGNQPSRRLKLWSAASRTMRRLVARDRSPPPAAGPHSARRHSSLSAKACLRFVTLTACRSGEDRLAKWDEIDRQAREWRIPCSRMKAGIEHRIPLGDAALAVLNRARALRDESDLISPFLARRRHPMSDMTLTKVLRDIGLADRATVHGFRCSFRDWAAEQTDASHAVTELSIAHMVGNAVEQAYTRSDFLARWRNLMQEWADFLSADLRHAITATSSVSF